MKHDLFLTCTILIASLALYPLILPVASSATELMEGAKSFPEGQDKRLKTIAAGSAEDTLKTCLARIPLDASVGQRLLAEQNYQQVEGERTETTLTF